MSRLCASSVPPQPYRPIALSLWPNAAPGRAAVGAQDGGNRARMPQDRRSPPKAQQHGAASDRRLWAAPGSAGPGKGSRVAEKRTRRACSLAGPDGGRVVRSGHQESRVQSNPRPRQR